MKNIWIVMTSLDARSASLFDSNEDALDFARKECNIHRKNYLVGKIGENMTLVRFVHDIKEEPWKNIPWGER